MSLRSKFCKMEQRGETLGRLATGTVDHVIHISLTSDVLYISSEFKALRPSALLNNNRTCGSYAGAENCITHGQCMSSLYSGSASFCFEEPYLHSTNEEEGEKFTSFTIVTKVLLSLLGVVNNIASVRGHEKCS